MTSFLDDLQQQLVAASRSLAPELSTATTSTPRWWRSVRRSSLVLIGVLVVTGTAVAATTGLIGNSSDESLRVVDRLASMPEGGAHRYVRANGLDPTSAALAFVTPAGLRVYAVRDSQATCIMVSDGDDQCYRATTIPSGLGFSIASNCTVGGDRRMRIAGAAPAGAAGVHVNYSSGPGRTTNVVDDVFVIDTTTPTHDQPHPVALQFLDRDKATIVTRAIDYGNDLCLRQSGS